MTIKITKQLATMEDLAIGAGTVLQTRNGVQLTLTKIDMATKAELAGDPNNGLGAALVNGVTTAQELDTAFDTRLGTAGAADIGSSANQVPDKAVLDARLNTTGNLGDAASANFGTNSGDVPKTLYQEITVNTGSFAGNSFTLKCLKIGRQVTIWSDVLPSHASSFSPGSSSGTIPAAFVPAVERTTGVGASAGHIQNTVVRGDGTFMLTYYSKDGGGVANTTKALDFPLIVYAV